MFCLLYIGGGVECVRERKKIFLFYRLCVYVRYENAFDGFVATIKIVIRCAEYWCCTTAVRCIALELIKRENGLSIGYALNIE